ITTTHQYDELRRRIASTRAGVTTHTEYDAQGRVAFTWQTPENASNPLDPALVIGRSTAAPVYNSHGELTESTDPAGRVTTYARSVANGIVTRTTTLPGGATLIDKSYADGTPIESLGSGQRHMTQSETWNANGERIVEQAYTANPDDFSRSISDFLGRTLRTEQPSPTGTGLAVTHYHYEPGTGRLLKTVDPSGLATLYFYNDLGEQTLTVVDVNDDGEIDWAGPDRIQESETVYEQYASDPTLPPDPLDPLEPTDPWWRVTRTYTYKHGSDQPVLVSTTWTSLDGLESLTDSLGLISHSKTVRTPNAALRTHTATAPDGSYTVSVTQNGLPQYTARYDADDVQLSRQDFGYDEWNRRNQVTDAGTGTTLTTFHVDGSVATVTQNPGTALEQQTAFLSSGLGTLGYTTSGGRIEQVTLSDSTTVIREYYPTGELMSQYGSRQYPVAYTHDYAGRMKTLTTWQDFDGDTGAAVTTWNYNDAGVLVSKRYPDTLGPDYEYDIRGLLAKRTWARGAETVYTYNALGELTNVDYPGSATPSVVNSYDRQGRLTEVQDASGTREYVYEDFQLVREKYTAGLLEDWKIERNYDALRRAGGLELYEDATLEHAVVYDYDTASRVATVTGHSITNTYTYSANRHVLDQLDQGGVQTVVWTHDNLNRLTSIATDNGTSTLSSHMYLYNDANQRTRATLMDGSYWEYTYDALGQVTGGVKKESGGAVLNGYDFSYTFDDIGNRKTFTENSQTTTYEANLLNQYTEIDRPAFTNLRGDRVNTNTTIHVDLLGDGNPAVEASYNNLLWHRQMAVTDPVSEFDITATENGNSNSVTGSLYTPNGVEVPQFDDDGNLTRDHLWQYTWNSENRLVRQENREDINISPLIRTRMEYTYDSQGRRVRRIISRWDGGQNDFVVEEDLRFVYDNWNLIAEIDASGDVVRSYVWGLDLSGDFQGVGGVGGLLSVESGSTVALAVYDGNGNVMVYTDASTGNPIAEYEYDPFGRRIKTKGAQAENYPHRFSTKYEESESGFLYYGFRSFNPEIGRWLNRDPIEEEGGYNLYGFVENDGVNFLDNMGMSRFRYNNVFDWLDAPESNVFIAEFYDRGWEYADIESGFSVTVRRAVFNFMNSSGNRVREQIIERTTSIPRYELGITISEPSEIGIKCGCSSNEEKNKYSAAFFLIVESKTWIANRRSRGWSEPALSGHIRDHRVSDNWAEASQFRRRRMVRDHEIRHRQHAESNFEFWKRDIRSQMAITFSSEEDCLNAAQLFMERQYVRFLQRERLSGELVERGGL
ncbi:MAG: RHS repeat-associated core domain-containing protein, partial [Verrucomicrobia bacterium]|nr:RHS repeat-associated core domain-containing protein [Verrucomicrobiota bacterium]